MPALVDLVVRNDLDEPDLQRLRGVHRHVWASNALKLKHLFVALDVLGNAGIRPMLLKGGALFARLPQLASRRPAGDYDILVSNTDLVASTDVLDKSGFSPVAMNWQSVINERDAIETSGIALERGDKDSRVDLHWRPLMDLRDPGLTERLFAAAEAMTLQGRPVAVPTPTHHLFLSIARCDPYDHRENFQRLLEGYMLLSGLGPARIDWRELAFLVRQYGLEAVAGSYLTHIARDCELELDQAKLEGLLRCKSGGSWLETRLRTIPPVRRKPLQNWFLARRERNYLRAPTQDNGQTLAEAWFVSSLKWLPSSINGVRRAMLGRIWPRSGGEDAFIEGWFYSEPEGRWTNGKLAALIVPLSAAERDGQPVVFRGHLMPGARNRARLVVTGGAGIFKHRQVGPPSSFDFAMVVKPEQRLGGDGLVVFWMPNATSPRERGESKDGRCLGLFLRNGAGA